MTLRELYTHLSDRYPTSLSCEWDNDGVMLCLDWEKSVKKVLVCLDVTDEVVGQAVAGGFDLIVSHHPMIFHPIKGLNADEILGRRVGALIRSGISVFSFHTRLDAANDGLNDALARALGLAQIQPVTLPGDPSPLGRLGQIEPCGPQELGQKVARALKAPVKVYSAKNKIERVLSVCGGGKDFLPLAATLEADAFVSGDLSYNAVLDTLAAGITVIDAGHRATELLCCSLLTGVILAFDATLKVETACDGVEEQWILP